MKKSLLITLVILATSIVGAFLLTNYIKLQSPKGLWERETTGLNEAQRALKLTEDKISSDTTLIIGSSVSMRGKHLGHETRNLGFFASTPILLTALTKKIEIEGSAKPKIISAIEFLPQNLTKTSVANLAEMTKLRLALFITYEDLFKLAQKEPRFASEVLSKKLLGVSSPEINTNLVTHEVKKIFPPEEHKLLPRPEKMRHDVDDQIRRYDLLNLEFDPTVIDEYFSLIKMVEAFSACTVIFAPPDNTDHWQRTEIGEKRLAALKQNMLQVTGHKVIDLSDYENFPEKLFRNATHLDYEEGQKTFDRALTLVLNEQCSK